MFFYFVSLLLCFLYCFFFYAVAGCSSPSRGPAWVTLRTALCRTRRKEDFNPQNFAMYRTFMKAAAAAAAGLPAPVVNKSTAAGKKSSKNERRARNHARNRRAARGESVYYRSNPLHPHCRETRYAPCMTGGSYGSEPTFIDQADVEILSDTEQKHVWRRKKSITSTLRNSIVDIWIITTTFHFHNKCPFSGLPWQCQSCDVIPKLM